MLRSLFSGVSGLKNQQAYMDVIANNISNVNTVGYKSGRITFTDTLSDTLSDARGSLGNFGGVNPIQIGLGSRISSIDTDFTGGDLESTGLSTDLGLSGDGFFVVSDGSKNYYTRAGAFEIDSSGKIIAQGGTMYLQGRMADEDGNLTSSTVLEDITLPFGKKDPAKATENISLTCNLDQSASETEQWLADTALKMDGEAISNTANLSSIDLSEIDGFTIRTGDVIEITGTDRDGAAIDVNFAYGTDGASLQDLMDAVNVAFDSTSADGATLTLDDNGYLRLTANKAGESEFSFALIPPDTAEATAQAHTATTQWTVSSVAANSPTDLAALAGVTLVATDVIDITGTDADGNTITVSFEYGTDGTTVGDLLNAFNDDTTGFPGVTASISDGYLQFENDETGAGVNTVIDTIDAGGTYGLTTAFTTVDGTDATNVVTPAFTVSVEGLTGTHSTAITVYDSRGTSHDITVEFTQDPNPGSNFWTWRAVIDDGNVSATGGNTGTVVFNEDGSLKQFTYDSETEALTFNIPGAKEMSIQFDAGTSGAYDGITQFDSASTTIAIEQDGYTLGVLSSVAIDDQGIVSGYYTNGQTKTLAQVALANFTNQGGLKKEGDSQYSANEASGSPIISWAGSNTTTTINAGYLEASNVDLTEQFANMIIAQRALEANAKTISAADTILSTIIDRMKRS